MNSIMGTLDYEGKQTNCLDEMKNRAIVYFAQLYASEDRPPPIPNLNIDTDNRPTEEQNARPRAIPSESKIWTSLKTMASGKTPGMDDLTAEIIKHHCGDTPFLPYQEDAPIFEPSNPHLNSKKERAGEIGRLPTDIMLMGNIQNLLQGAGHAIIEHPIGIDCPKSNNFH